MGLSLSEEPTLSRSGHDRVAWRRDDAAWLNAAWERARVLVVTPDYSAPVVETASGPRLDLRPSSSVPADAERYFLGVDGETPLFAVRAGRDHAHAASDNLRRAERTRWADLRSVGASLNDLDAGLLTTAAALARWHDRHPRCSLCGAPTVLEKAGWSRRCPADSSEHFPRTDPAVIMLVHDGGDRCVLGRQASWPPGRYSILAGFVEPGESAEAAVAREVAEEVGLAVSDVHYAGSQPWPFPSSLMLGYSAQAVGDLTLHLRDGELADALWVSREEIRRGDVVALPPPVSIAYRIITDWLDAG